MSLKKYGFTLAEVLITLGIIGVVAALTIPTIMAKQEEQANIAALKKAYSTLSTAYKLAERDNGSPDNWGITAGASPSVLSTLAPYLRVDKDCTDGSLGCFPSGVQYKYIKVAGVNGIYDTYANPKLKLVDGTLILGTGSSPSCSAAWGNSTALKKGCGIYDVDINGFKGPNQIGKDLFRFWLTKYGIVPVGSSQEITFTFANTCDIATAVGWGCTAWVLYNDNMDYIHCSGLSWDGKTKCD